jgi:hypothetical protein
MHITPQARSFLTKFWILHPRKRKACVRKYGFDPILQETNYWTHGIAEQDHAKVLAIIQRHNNTFSLPLARLWAIQELQP